MRTITVHVYGQYVHAIQSCIEKVFQENIDIVEKRCRMNDMKLNAIKSKCILLETSKNTNKNGHL